MRVGIDETRRDRTPVQIDDSGLRPHHALNVAVTPDRHNATVLDRQRLRHRVVGIDRDDVSVQQHEICGIFNRGLRSPGKRCSRDQRDELPHRRDGESKRAIRDCGVHALHPLKAIVMVLPRA